MTSSSSFFFLHIRLLLEIGRLNSCGSLSPVTGTGDVKLSTSLTLLNVLHVPQLSCNLLSIGKLTHELNCHAKFFHSHCEFQNTVSGKMLGNARECGGLYILV